jgi:hypothetical protein
MTLFTALSLTDSVGSTRFGIRRGNHSARLVDILRNRHSARAALMPTAAQARLLRIQAAVQDLFADTRRQQMQSLDTTYIVLRLKNLYLDVYNISNSLIDEIQIS